MRKMKESKKPNRVELQFIFKQSVLPVMDAIGICNRINNKLEGFGLNLEPRLTDTGPDISMLTFSGDFRVSEDKLIAFAEAQLREYGKLMRARIIYGENNDCDVPTNSSVEASASL